MQNVVKTLGDTLLKEFSGTLDQFKTRSSVEHVIATTSNIELRELLKSYDVGLLIEKGYTVSGVFVTNAITDVNAKNYLKTRADIRVFDGNALRSEWVAPGDSSPVHNKVSFSLDGLSTIEYRTTEATVFIAPLLASELITLGGIQSTELFDWNVRKSLGKTKVNKAIADSIAKQEEHKNFVLYHNGLTILAETAELTPTDKLEVNDYTVVNGCQSLTTLFQNKAFLSNELRVVTRIIKLSPQSQLAAKITRHSNNQNSISARDLQSNSTIQRRLQADFQREFGSGIFYEIKRGEISTHGEDVITNEEAARMLLAFDVEEPWACHQSYRLFDDLHSEIFGRPEVNAVRIVVLHAFKNAILEAFSDMKDQLIARYRLTTYFMMYLLRNAIKIDEEGKQFLASPHKVMKEIGIDGLKKIALAVVSDLIIDFDAELEERQQRNEPFDHKRELKSPTAVRKLTAEVLASYQKGVRRGKSVSFSSEVRRMRELVQRGGSQP